MGWNSDQYPSNWNSIRKRILKRDGYRCTKCGTSDDQLHVHHITPVSEGGSHSPMNLRTLCHSCHENAHGHRIPTKEGSYNSSASKWKKAVWLPSWDSSNSRDTDFGELIEPFHRENARTKEDWIARQIGALSAFVVFIYPGILAVQDTATFAEGPFITIIGVFLVPLIMVLIPIIGIPFLIIVFLTGFIVWRVSRFALERYHGTNP